jgi:hypothetical protein
MQLCKRTRIHLTASSKWDDALNQPLVSLDEAGLEESHLQPAHDTHNVPDIVFWFSDGEDSRYSEY